MKHTPLLAGTLLALAPVVVLTIPGCGGGSGLIPIPTATPTGTATATPTGTTATPAPVQTSNLTLGNGQRAILTTRTTGNTVNGTLQILATVVPKGVKVRAIPFLFTVGTYTITGTVTPPRGYSIQGNFGSFGAFQMTGLLPTATQAGSYTLTVNGQTETGIVPIPGQPVPTTTPTTPPSGSYNLTNNLTFSNVSSGSDVLPTSLSSLTALAGSGLLTTVTVNGSQVQTFSVGGNDGPATGDGTRRQFSLNLFSYTTTNDLKKFSVGQVIPLNLVLSQSQLSQTTVQGTSFKIGAWRTTSGTATIKALGTNSVTVDLNAHYDPTGFAGGNGSFDLKGTVTATGLTVKTQ